MRPDPRIGELLVAVGAIARERVGEALSTQPAGGRLLGRILVEAGACRPEDVGAALKRQMRVTGVGLSRAAPLPEALRLMPGDTCRRSAMLPFERLGGMLCAATANTISRKAALETERLTGFLLKALEAPRDEVMAAIAENYPEG